MQKPEPEVVDVSSSDKPARALIKTIAAGAPSIRVVYARDWYLWDRTVAAAARELFETGNVDLVQRRIPGLKRGKFEYIAIKRQAPKVQRAPGPDQRF
ncbi:hypothetical protein [Leisingera aquimarina]|uniref:hypothetical protein n=1 Tax=Leisingera aquimarina TaxID=476529 RepID=UPI00047FADE6|nr:hypothetical protein [Leisingera aquimarina]